MAVKPVKRDFLAIPDFSREELDNVLDLASRMKSGAYTSRPLAGKSLAMLFAKSSTRTRVSVPSRETVGRNVAGRAFVEVGETRVVLNAANSSAWTTTA